MFTKLVNLVNYFPPFGGRDSLPQSIAPSIPHPWAIATITDIVRHVK